MNLQFFKGSFWSAQKIESTYIVSVNEGMSIIDGLSDFLKTQKIKNGKISGIGFMNDVSIRYFDPISQKYVDQVLNGLVELSEISGNISEMNGKPMLYLRINLHIDGYTTLTGQLLEAKVCGKAEFFMHALDSQMVNFKNKILNLNLNNWSCS
ncbi:PPC domain-containing DNA-binding protein [Chryseobacterium sp. JUb7]|uniref:PPC domain-containing DNA-binding protein n=1 Tax=Chryseobacterium sp. JUb7 TaxID=2940599 RepID=UPI002168401A|nr:PPC domain-containing DNA-binding protein [Chryseobacterium sp. JUb7]MCS3528993.1 putative DNA-binding protein with PD1-like motif [Chryseobacterium sp. JUb7]